MLEGHFQAHCCDFGSVTSRQMRISWTYSWLLFQGDILKYGEGGICESKVKEPKIAAFNGWICLGIAWKRRETLTDEVVLCPEPSEGREELRIHMGQLSFALSLVAGSSIFAAI